MELEQNLFNIVGALMPDRRHFIKLAAGLPLYLSFAGCTGSQQPENAMQDRWLMPDEAAIHQNTWMAFAPTEQVWGKDLIEEVKRNIALIAETIARFEPVVLCLREEEIPVATEYFESLDNIFMFPCPLDDIWIRDYGPLFVSNSAGKRGIVDFNFNGWGGKQDFEQDSQVAATAARELDIKLIETSLRLEGGGIEVDGRGTAIITESCVLNENRNPGVSKAACEEELRYLLGIEKVIWLPGMRGQDITDGHTDFYARFTSPGVVVAHYDPDPDSPEHQLTLDHIDILNASTDAEGRRLEVVEIEPPEKLRPGFANEDFCAGYINFYVCNGAVIAPEFGDMRADSAAREKLDALFPYRDVVMLNIDGIAAGGGGIHCVTQQEPAV